jgi:hypothetical protein
LWLPASELSPKIKSPANPQLAGLFLSIAGATAPRRQIDAPMIDLPETDFHLQDSHHAPAGHNENIFVLFVTKRFSG